MRYLNRRVIMLCEEEEIFRFKISMRNTFCVAIINCLHYLCKDSSSINFTEETSFDDSVK